MQKFLIQFAALALVAAGSTAAQAQEAVRDCNAFVSGQEFDTVLFNACAAGQQARASTMYVPTVVQRALKNSFGFGPSSVEPAGLSDIVDGEAASRLEASPIIITPTADMSASVPAAP